MWPLVIYSNYFKIVSAVTVSRLVNLAYLRCVSV